MNDTNWAKRGAKNVSDSDKKALAAAKKVERQRIKDGYKWYVINERLKVLVPCKKDGTPTEKGLKIIDVFVKKYSIS